MLTDTLANRVREALSGIPQVEEKRMFGGIAFMVRDKMCVSAGKGRIMCRIDPDGHDAALERKGCRAVEMKGRSYRGYVHVDATAVKTKPQLTYWVELALAYNDKGIVPATPSTPPSPKSPVKPKALRKPK